LIYATTALAVIMGLLYTYIRFRSAKKPASEKKIILPPFFMSTGALMFVFPTFQIGLDQALGAFLVGCFFSVFLIKTSKFEIREKDIYLKRSKAFVVILFSLLAIRTVAKIYLGHQISVPETSGLFFLLAFGMIIPWRVAMLLTYKKIKKQLQQSGKCVLPT
jgi:membrane protein CcdC involved in cytochrome C biogenesis